jgi:hypothetical protein
VRDLAEEGVAAVGRPEVQDGALVGDRDEVALVVGVPWPEVLEVTGDVDGADEAVRLGRSLMWSTPTRAIRIMCRRPCGVGQLDTGRRTSPAATRAVP